MRSGGGFQDPTQMQLAQGGLNLDRVRVRDRADEGIWLTKRFLAAAHRAERPASRVATHVGAVHAPAGSKRVILALLCSLLICLQLRTYRSTAQSDAMCHKRVSTVTLNASDIAERKRKFSLGYQIDCDSAQSADTRAREFLPTVRRKRREATPSPGSPRDRGRSQRQPARARQASNPLRSNSNRRIAEGIGRAVAALEPDLMSPVSIGEAHPVILCQLKAAARVRIGHNLGTRHFIGIKLVIPRRIERVGPIHSFGRAFNSPRLSEAPKLLPICSLH
jgi:hypothetical protein